MTSLFRVNHSFRPSLAKFLNWCPDLTRLSNSLCISLGVLFLFVVIGSYKKRNFRFFSKINQKPLGDFKEVSEKFRGWS